MAVDKPRDLSSEQSFGDGEGAGRDAGDGKRAGRSLDSPQDREALHRHTETIKSRRHEETSCARSETADSSAGAVPQMLGRGTGTLPS